MFRAKGTQSEHVQRSAILSTTKLGPIEKLSEEPLVFTFGDSHLVRIPHKQARDVAKDATREDLISSTADRLHPCLDAASGDRVLHHNVHVVVRDSQRLGPRGSDLRNKAPLGGNAGCVLGCAQGELERQGSGFGVVIISV